jgi:hypothetical protein
VPDIDPLWDRLGLKRRVDHVRRQFRLGDVRGQFWFGHVGRQFRFDHVVAPRGRCDGTVR